MKSSPAQPSRIIPRRQAFAAIGWSSSTGRRREKSDPNMPDRVAIGPLRYGFRLDEWERYVAALPRVSGDVAPPVELAAHARKAGIASGVARRAGRGEATQ